MLKCFNCGASDWKWQGNNGIIKGECRKCGNTTKGFMAKKGKEEVKENTNS